MKTEPKIDIKEKFGFGRVITEAKAGRESCRQGWNGKGLKVGMKKPENGSDMTLPYLYLKYPPDAKVKEYQNCCVPWFPSVTDLLAEDWMLAD